MLREARVKLDAYESVIVPPSGKRGGRYTGVNLLDSFHVVNRSKSIFEVDPDFRDTNLVKEALKKQIENARMTGVEFEPVEVG